MLPVLLGWTASALACSSEARTRDCSKEGKNTLAVTSHVPMTPLDRCVASGDEVGATTCQVTLQQVPAPETPDIRLMFNPEGLSNQEMEKLVEVGTAEALEKLHQALSVHNKRLTFALQH